MPPKKPSTTQASKHTQPATSEQKQPKKSMKMSKARESHDDKGAIKTFQLKGVANDTTLKNFKRDPGSIPLCAGYLRYTDQRQMEEMRNHFLVLEAVLAWDNAFSRNTFQNCAEIRFPRAFHDKPLRWIRDELLEAETEEREQKCPATYQEIVNYYQPPNDAAKDVIKQKTSCIYSCIVYRLAENIRAWDPNTRDPDKDQARQKQAVVAILENKKRKDEDTQDVIIPRIDPSKVKMPDLGPHEALAEDPLEAYARANIIIKSYVHGSYTSRASAKGTIGDRKPIGDSHIPLWMRYLSSSVSQADIQDALQMVNPMPTWVDEARQVRVVRKTSSRIKEHLTRISDDKDLTYPKDEYTFDSRLDPRAYATGEEWRDTIKTRLQLEHFRVDWKSVELQFPNPEHVKDSETSEFRTCIVFNRDDSSAVQTWKTIQDTFGKEKGSGFVYRLNVLEDDEDCITEYEGLPTIMENFETGALAPESGTGVENSLPDHETKKEHINGLLQGIGGGEHKDWLRAHDPLYLFGDISDHKIRDDHYGHDVRTKAGRIAYRKQIIDACVPQKITPRVPPISVVPNTLSKEDNSAIRQHEKQTEDIFLMAQTIPSSTSVTNRYDADTNSDTERAWLESSNVGPPIYPSRTALEMQEPTEAEFRPGFKVSACGWLRGKQTYLDVQVTGCAAMLAKSFGRIPEPAEPSNSERSKACDRIQEVRTCGGALCDMTGIGKSETALLTATLISKNADNTDFDGNTCYRPGLLVAPLATLHQWYKYSKKYTEKKDLKVLFCASAQSKDRFGKSYINPAWLKTAPENLKKWPAEFQYIFDQKDRNAKDVLIITSYEIFSESSTDLTPLPDNRERTWKTRFAGRFSYVMMDEGHRARNPGTRMDASLALEAPVTWSLTASPVVNSCKDIEQHLTRMWPALKRQIEADSIAKGLMEQNLRSQKIVEKIEGLPKLSIARALILEPKRFASILKHRSVDLKAKAWKIIEDLIIIRRSSTSQLPYSFDDRDGHLDLKTMMPAHEVKTTNLTKTLTEALEHEAWHYSFAREEQDALKNCRGHEEEGKAPSGDPNALSRILQFRRKLTIATASTKLSRLEHVLNKFELGTLMQNIETQNFRSCHHDVDWMINITKRPSDGAIKNREDRLRYLCEGSPKLRYLLQQLRDIVDKKQNDKPHKILLTEDVPTVAWFWELVCRWLYIDARVLHSGMTQTERDDLVDRFNDPTDPLCVLINMYSVSATGINLDRSCCYILIMTPGPSPSHEVQAWGRVRRVTQRHKVIIVRVNVLNSHDQYRDSRQQDKALRELAVRTYCGPMAQILVRLLKDHHDEVLKAHATSQSRLPNASDARAQAKDTTKVDNEGTNSEQSEDNITSAIEGSATTAFGANEARASDATIEAGSTRRSSRVKKQPQRFRSSASDQERAEVEGADEESGVSENESGSDDEEYIDKGPASFLREEYETDEEDEVETDDEENAKDETDTLMLSEQKKQFKQLGVHLQEDFDHDRMLEEILLMIPTSMKYKVEDLKKPLILGRALRILNCNRLGVEYDTTRISTHIKYRYLSKEQREAQELRKITRLEDGDEERLKQLAHTGESQLTPKKRDSMDAESTPRKKKVRTT